MKKYLILLMLGLAACSNSQQEEETRRQERQEQEIAKARQEQQARKEQEQPAEPEQPAAPPEPEYREVTTYYFTSATEKTVVECHEEPELTNCGVTFKDCNGSEYYCQVSVRHFTKTKKELVTE